MSFELLFRATALWLIIAVLAVANGGLREKLLLPLLGERGALPLSGLLLCLIVFLATYAAFGLIGPRSTGTYWMIGLQWVLMTLAFEFLFGHYVVGKSWPTLLQTFNLARGDLFLLVLLSSLVSPYLVARLKGILS